ncbi:hypothetical protein I4F81_011752 [Pyropia yezoensis]|uniref:Uncharacterized protein n=1 Tax=Pyropia yezoensis TaxID=2788 RepID=A0ACC3CGS6_PYRYE|nr:hypothetical protein I4F81_011752 [Neopyropia yezoensis]
MPVGTQASVKGVAPAWLADPAKGAQVVLVNTYHLGTRPGGAVVDALCGLGEMMRWPRGTLTDSGDRCNWKYLLRRLEGYGGYANLSKLHSPALLGLRYLSDYSAGEAAELLADPAYTKFVLVRDPYTCLLSAYMDKIASTQPTFVHAELRAFLAHLMDWRWVKARVASVGGGGGAGGGALPPDAAAGVGGAVRVAEVGGGGGSGGDRNGVGGVAVAAGGVGRGGSGGIEAAPRPSFRAFVDELLKVPPAAMNPHWAPQSLLCGFGEMPYDFVGRFERLAADAATLLAHIGAPPGGGLDLRLRGKCAAALVARDLPGYAVGGLSGGEEKGSFWPAVAASLAAPPPGKPCYCMGVGCAEYLVVCVALGADMFDCAYPARTARFGTDLVPGGLLKLRSAACAADFRPVDSTCPCSACTTYTRSYLHALAGRGGEGVAVAGQLLTLHNVAYLTGLMRLAQTAILDGVFPDWVRAFTADLYPGGDYPQLSSDALAAAGIPLGESGSGAALGGNVAPRPLTRRWTRPRRPEAAASNTEGLTTVIINAGVGVTTLLKGSCWVGGAQPILRVNLLGAVATVAAALRVMSRRQ